MRRSPSHTAQAGFTLIELLTALGIFLLLTGAAFTLLSSSQQRYQTDSQVLTSFQEARLGLDQMVRDIDDAGYPARVAGAARLIPEDSPAALVELLRGWIGPETQAV